MTVVTPRILVVSGSRICRRVVEMTFADQPVELDIATTCEAAIAAWDDRPAAVVLVDLGLEPPGALALVSHVRAHAGDRHVGVLAMAGPADVVDDASYGEAGVDGVLRKPLDSLQLIEAVRDVLRAARAPREDRGAGRDAAQSTPAPVSDAGIVAMGSPDTRLDDADLERVAARVAVIWGGDARREAEVRDVVTARAEGLAAAVAERLVREMAPAVVQEVARLVVADVSERLVREEISRLRAQYRTA